MRVGVNHHPPHGRAQLVLDITAQMVRFQPWRENPPGFYAFGNYNPFIDQCIDNGTDVLLVIDNAVHDLRRPGQGWAYFYRSLRVRYPRVRNWQILNEVDGQEGGASGPKPPSIVNTRLKAARTGLGADVTIYAPGLVSGDASYLGKLDLSPVDIVSIHLYGVRPNATFPAPDWGFTDVADVISRYRAVSPRIPFAITEFGGGGDLFNSEHERAVYFTEMIQALSAEGVDEALVYCLTDSQWPAEGGGGLVDGGGVAKESWPAVKDAIIR